MVAVLVVVEVVDLLVFAVVVEVVIHDGSRASCDVCWFGYTSAGLPVGGYGSVVD